MSDQPAAAPGLLVDPRCGIVRELRDVMVPDRFPRGYVQVASRLSDSRAFSAWASDSAGAGYAFDDREAAVAAALGEAVERYSGNLVPAELVHASYDDLTAGGLHAVDPSSLALFSAEQHAQPGFPWQPFDRATRTHWAPGSTRRGRCVLVPAALVWPTYALAAATDDRLGPAVCPVLQAGLAAGPTREFAESGALLELLERDAVALAWHGRGGVQELVVDDDLAGFARGPRDLLEVRFLLFPQEHGVPVVGALVRDRVTGHLSLGSACRTQARDAALKALAEALQLSLLLAEYDDPDGAFAAAARSAGSPLRSWRADRAYADSYAEDLSDVRDYGCHLQLALDPVVQAAVETELADATTGHRDLAEVPPGDLPAIAAALDPVAVDVTTDDVRRAGLHVTRVVVPGLLCNSAAGFPLLGSPRLRAALAGRPRRVLPLPH